MSIWGLLIYGVFACICYGIADSKGRSGVGYLFLSLIITPIAVLIILLCLGDTDEKIYEKELIKVKAQDDARR
ncbi:hypothetical protein HPX47_001622 [Vibrio alginolyticus]|nr:hypothetical protein [Vibrio alginolyticus]